MPDPNVVDSEQDFILYDTSLRDGVQQRDGDMPKPENAVMFAKRCIGVGVRYVEIGLDKNSPVFQELLKAATSEGFLDCISVFSMTRGDEVASLLNLGIQNATLVCKARIRDVRISLNKEPSTFLKEVYKYIKLLRMSDINPFVDLEHAVDAYFGYCVHGKKMNSEDALESRRYFFSLVKTCVDAGAHTLVVCDTNGRASQHEIREIFGSLMSRFPGVNFGFHCHDDRCRALVNSQEAYLAGVRHIQFTFDGRGERRGNANWITFLCDTQLQDGTRLVSNEVLQSLTGLNVDFSFAFNRVPDPLAPYVGVAVTSTKAGIHVSGEERDPGSYHCFSPEAVGNRSRLAIDHETGQAGIRNKSSRIGVPLDPEQVVKFLNDEYNALLLRTKVFMLCEGSFRLACLRISEGCMDLFDVVGFRAGSNLLPNVTRAHAKLELQIGDEEKIHTVRGIGKGIFDAAYTALHSKLLGHFPAIKYLQLVHYEVTSLGVQEHKSSAVTRVILTFEIHDTRWSVGGVSQSLESAGLKALVDGIHLHLISGPGCSAKNT